MSKSIKDMPRNLQKRSLKLRRVYTNYIPYHGVTNVNEPGKVRVVYDAAAFNIASLNKSLLEGPDLTGILLRFCSRRYAVKLTLVRKTEMLYNSFGVKTHFYQFLNFL